MANVARQRRLAERIQHIVAEMLELRIKDPRLGFITITDVRVTPDLREASIFYTVLGDVEEHAATAAALASATGVIRSEVGKQTGIKFTPTLEFIPDAVPENARHVEELLAQAAAADAAVHEQAARAQFAGDPDPYRHENEDDEADEDDHASSP
jgi:ribosome-binding factor A